MYDRVLKATTKDLSTGKTYDSTEQRYSLGGVFRYPFGHAATAPVVLASFSYTSQLFKIGGAVDAPDVKYSLLEPGLGLRYPLMAKLIFALDGRVMLARSTGQIQTVSQYGAASVLGFEGVAGFDYLVTRNLFARAAFRYETIGFTFKGTGDQALSRDGDAMTQDVTTARDNYLGGLVTIGYAY
jgi:opacity protein-like surface antigen